jgi:aromatic-L-amino-acid decarboxylase
VWLHVDGAYGLPAALVVSHAPLFRGLARADSVTVDAHKWLFVPKACGVLMVREAEWLERAFTHEATYVPHAPGEQDAVDRTLEYSRPFRALKLWLALRVHGLAAYRSAIERNLSEARLFADLVKERDELELLGEPELSVVPFRHIATSGPVDEHNRKLAAALRADGRVYVSGAEIDGTACLRPCFVNFRTSPEDVRVLRDVVLELGAKLA